MAGAEDKECPTCVEEWRMVLNLVEHCFINDNAEDVRRDFEIGVLALMPKDVMSCHGIMLIKMVHKVASTIVPFRLSNGVEFHDAVCGFQAKRGAGTAIIPVQVADAAQELWGREHLHHVFGSPEGTLHDGQNLDTCNLGRVWSWTKHPSLSQKDLGWRQASIKQAGFHGEPFDAGRGVRCGDIDSPVIFNIVVVAIIQDIEACRLEELATTVQIVCANDGVIADDEPEKVQKLADDHCAERFA